MNRSGANTRAVSRMMAERISIKRIDRHAGRLRLVVLVSELHDAGDADEIDARMEAERADQLRPGDDQDGQVVPSRTPANGRWPGTAGDDPARTSRGCRSGCETPVSTRTVLLAKTIRLRSGNGPFRPSAQTFARFRLQKARWTGAPRHAGLRQLAADRSARGTSG